MKECCSKGIPEEVLEGAFVDAYNELCRTHKTSFKALYEDVTGRINAVTMDIERLKGDKAKTDDMHEKLSSIESMIKEGNEIKEFNRYLFETMVEKVIVGEGDDPYKIKFFLKTKQQYNVNAAEYILKSKAGKTINGITYQQQATDPAKQEVDKSTSTCRDGNFVVPTRSQRQGDCRHR